MIGSTLGAIGVVIAAIVLGMVADRRWGVLGVLPRRERLRASMRPKLSPAHAPGDAPGTALAVSGEELARLRGRQRCPACRVPLDATADDHVTYDQCVLLVLGFHCPRCPHVRSVYVRGPAAGRALGRVR